jgi:hypothetical protein
VTSIGFIEKSKAHAPEFAFFDRKIACSVAEEPGCIGQPVGRCCRIGLTHFAKLE